MAKKNKTSKGKKQAKAGTIAKLRSWLGQLMSALLVRARKLIRWGLIGLAVLITVPALLTILYRFDFVKPASTLMFARQVTLQPMAREWVSFEDVAPVLYQSVLMSEDGQFCAHNGVDWDAINLVITDALEGERPRGASTITMQTAKNLFLWNGRSYLRKALEIPLALWIDLIIPKKRIMEIYLNIAEWDNDGVFGVQAGSMSQFGRSASKLTRKQAALMAVTLPNPILREPARPTKGLRRLADKIEVRARQSGAYIKCLK